MVCTSQSIKVTSMRKQSKFRIWIHCHYLMDFRDAKARRVVEKTINNLAIHSTQRHLQILSLSS
jgi:hypothetical protein